MQMRRFGIVDAPFIDDCHRQIEQFRIWHEVFDLAGVGAHEHGIVQIECFEIID